MCASACAGCGCGNIDMGYESIHNTHIAIQNMPNSDSLTWVGTAGVGCRYFRSRGFGVRGGGVPGFLICFILLVGVGFVCVCGAQRVWSTRVCPCRFSTIY